MSQPAKILLPTRTLSPQQEQILRGLQPGQRIKLVQTLRVGSRKWTTETVGIFREINYLVTGLTTDRVPEDDVIMPMVHFTKENGEMSSIALDENSQVTTL